MYVVQIAAVLFVTWASIYYEWNTTGPAVAVVALFAAAVATLAIVELKALPSRFTRLRSRIFGLKHEPGDEIASLGTAFRHPRNAVKDWGGLRIGENPRQLVEIASELPLTVLVTDERPPFTRTEPRFDSLPDNPASGHGPKLLGVERRE